jgi:hypothetical protein
MYSSSYNVVKLILLLLLWSDTWLASGKSVSAMRWVMQLRPAGGELELNGTVLYNKTLYLELL